MKLIGCCQDILRRQVFPYLMSPIGIILERVKPPWPSPSDFCVLLHQSGELYIGELHAATSLSIAKQQGNVTLKARVANVCFKCFRCFRGMLQLFHMDVAKVDWDVAYAASVSDAYCKRLFKVFHPF